MTAVLIKVCQLLILPLLRRCFNYSKIHRLKITENVLFSHFCCSKLLIDVLEALNLCFEFEAKFLRYETALPYNIAQSLRRI